METKKGLRMDHLLEYYKNYDEDSRLLSQHGQVEYITTQKYIHEYLAGDKHEKILELGAGTGRYSVPLAKEGYNVTSMDISAHNLGILRKKLCGNEAIHVIQGNALDLSIFPDNTYDITLVLGPMYHMHSNSNKVRTLMEAVRVTKPSGHILVAYCMNEATVIDYVFKKGNLHEALGEEKLSPDWHCISKQKDVFSHVRTEDIARLDSCLDAKRLKLVATDGATNYMRDMIDALSKEDFEKWVEFHLSTCERQDLVGAAHHTLDILQKGA